MAITSGRRFSVIACPTSAGVATLTRSASPSRPPPPRGRRARRSFHLEPDHAHEAVWQELEPFELRGVGDDPEPVIEVKHRALAEQRAGDLLVDRLALGHGILDAGLVEPGVDLRV